MKAAYISAGLIGATLLAGCSAPVQSSDPIEGAWDVQSVHWITPEKTNSLDPAQLGRFLFVDGRYVLMWTATKDPRVPFENLSNPTDAETISAFRSVVYNTGTYSVDGDRVSTKAELARVPGFEGGQQFYDFVKKGDTLHLKMVDETYPNGDKPAWFGKMETLFVLKRAD